jgi:BMFP domain-containing protein YqiC
MSRKLTSIAQRIRRSLADMDYAQRRSFEIQTGIPATRHSVDSARDKALIAELEAHFRN